MDTPITFKQYLIKQGAYETFKENFYNYQVRVIVPDKEPACQKLKRLMRTTKYKFYLHCDPINSFLWEDTYQEYDYWHKIIDNFQKN